MIQRLIGWMGVLLLAVPMLAFADTYPASGGTVAATFEWSASYFSYSSLHKATANEACQTLCTQFSATCTAASETPGAACMQGGTQYGSASRTWLCATGSNNYNGTCTVPYTCPYGGTVSGSSCINAPACPTGQVRNATTGQCEVPPPPPCTADQAVSSGYYDYGLQPDSPMQSYGCSGGCEVVFEGDAPAARAIVNGKYHYFAKGSYVKTGTALTCGANTAPLGNAQALPQTTCASGQVIGQVNGQDRCVDPGTKAVTDPTTPKAPTTTTQQTTTVTNPDGSTTTTTTTNNPDGSQTVKTTTTASGGGSSSTTTTTTPGAGGSGSGGSGTGANNDPQKPCPEGSTAAFCKDKVKIDEDGTPSATDALKTQTEAESGLWSAQTAFLQGSSWRKSELSYVWNPAIPSGGSCGTWDFGKGTVNLCDAMTKVRALWAWAVVMIAMLAIWVRGTTAIGGTR